MKQVNALLSGVYGRVQKIVTRLALSGAGWFGYNLLSKEQTKSYLAPHLLVTHRGKTVSLSPVHDAADAAKTIFPPTDVVTESSSVWQYERGSEQVVQLRSGGLMSGRTVLNTDYWSHDLFKNGLAQKKRDRRSVQTLIAPFSHYFDNNVFIGYYDYVFLVAAKLCRIKAALPDGSFSDAVVSYPLVNTSYEREFLALIGFQPHQIVDSRQVSVAFERCLLGNHDNWAHQNEADIRFLKTQIDASLPIKRTERNRIYISRSGRRRILNEKALISLLERYDFQIIEDKPRSVAEQYAIYKNASFIMGPHGASFANILWCEPGTHLLELFSSNYVPNYFYYLAQVLGLHYSAYCQGDGIKLDIGTIAEDIEVSIDDLERCLIPLITKLA
ncbi:glycosyltransferase family 61 protein [Spirosoma arcticum]